MPIDVLAVSKLSPLYDAPLQAHYTVHDWLSLADDAPAFNAVARRIRAIAASGESQISMSLIERLPALEIISVFGVGYDGIDADAAHARGVMVTHTPDVLNDDVADLALGLMLAVARQLPACDQHVRQAQWAAKGPMPLGRKVSGSRLGLIGMGRIGQAIAHRALAFGMSVAYTSRSPRSDVPYPHLPSVTALAAQSDYLVVITPGGAGTRHLVNREVLHALGPQGVLVNVARGSVVDEDALIAALQAGEIAGAGLDVFAHEPHVPLALRELPNVVLTPHIGSATTQTRQAMAYLALRNLQAHFEGREVLTPVPECSNLFS